MLLGRVIEGIYKLISNERKSRGGKKGVEY